MTKTVLIAGASGSFGSNAVKAFKSAGWTVRKFNRATETLMNAAKGADVIVNAMNPPGYKNWATEIPRITKETIDAARATGTSIIVPGNVYNFGVQPAPWSEDTPQVPTSKKGQIRVKMEQQYRAAAETGVQVIVLRGGDFIDDKASENFFDMVIGKDVVKGKVTYPGTPDTEHAFAYLPDMARAAVMLAEKKKTLEQFEDVPFEGFTLTGNEIRKIIEGLSGKRQKLTSFPWWAIRMGAPFIALWKELLEMRYLWDHPHRLDNSKMKKLLPEFEPTPVDVALGAALKLQINPDQSMVGAHRFA